MSILGPYSSTSRDLKLSFQSLGVKVIICQIGGPGEIRTLYPPIMSRTHIPKMLPALQVNYTVDKRTGQVNWPVCLKCNLLSVCDIHCDFKTKTHILRCWGSPLHSNSPFIIAYCISMYVYDSQKTS